MMNFKKYSRHDDDRMFKMRTGQLKGKGRRDLSEGTYAIHDPNKLVKRPAGATLTPADIPDLVRTALASGGPIREGEAFEHLLAVTFEHDRYFAYHFIVTPPDAGPRRAILLSERTINCPYESERRFVEQLLAYSHDLGHPRVVLNESVNNLVRYLKDASGLQRYRYARFDYKPTEAAEQARHVDNSSLGFELYVKAMESSRFSHPLPRTLHQHQMDVGQAPDDRGRLSLRRMRYLTRDHAALSMVMLEEVHARNRTAFLWSALEEVEA